MPNESVAGSFRDPSGFVFQIDGSIYRQVNRCYQDNFEALIDSGLHAALTNKGLLVPHEEVDARSDLAPEVHYKTIKPEQIAFVSYPYEWSFSQLKDAALTTLAIQRISLKRGMTLKDCSAYNIQFHSGKPVFIDTLSFERYEEGMPWTPYRQFCQHFLAPLALMSYTDIRLNKLLTSFIDGIPLDLASAMLPGRTKWSIPLLLHIHAHAKSQKKYSDEAISKSNFAQKVSKTSLLGLLDNLKTAIQKLKWTPAGTEWADYYSDDSYTVTALTHKQALVKEYLSASKPTTVWDLGANNGFHSRLATELGASAIAFDVDPACVEMNYIKAKKDSEQNILPLLLDLTNPSPGVGWNNNERLPIEARGCADTAMALALIHHIAISNNVPLDRVAEYMAKLCRALIIEFVPKDDHKVQKLLATREDVFPGYTTEGFEAQFGQFFRIERKEQVVESKRILYLMSRR